MLVFEVDKRDKKTDIKKEIEEEFKIKVDKISSLIKRNKKYVYVRLNEKNPAIDIATSIGIV
jgi:ribosomal protein L23